jgi:translation initiation factor eIF-2B subunit gamma
LQQKPHVDSFREEFFPWLCKIQYQRRKREKYNRVLSPIANVLPQSLALRHSTLKHSTLEHTKEVNFSPTASPYLGNVPLSGPPSATDSEDDDTNSASLRIGVIIHLVCNGYAMRANNLQSYLALNRHFLADATYSLPSDPGNRSLIDQKAAISSDSIVGDSTRVEERASIKKSVIGKHCIIGKMVKIMGCVIMDHCIIADGAKLDGSILGKNTKVGAKAELIRCVTQPGYEVGTEKNYRNEKLDTSDWTAAREESEEEEKSEDGDSDGDTSSSEGSESSSG